MTDFYKQEKNVQDYIKNSQDYDGPVLIERLEEYLPPASSVLELEMGPGSDLQMLSESYRATGSAQRGRHCPAFVLVWKRSGRLHRRFR